MDEFKSSFGKYLNEFLRIRSVSVGKSTYERNVCNLHQFDDYFYTKYEGKSLFDHDSIIDWQLSLQKERGIDSKICIVRLFLQYYSIAVDEKVYIPKSKIRNHEFVPYIFSDDEFQKIIEYTDNYDRQQNFENSMILRLLYGSGLRINEALSLKMSNFLIDSGTLFLTDTKFCKERLVPMHSSLAELLEKYCYRRNLIGKADSFVFPADNKTGHISRDSIYSVFRKAMKNAGIMLGKNRSFERGPCFHSLRHVFTMKSCNQLESKGFSVYDSLTYISFYRGHDSIFETEKYLNYGSEMFPLELQKFENQSSSLYPEAKDDI